MRPLLAMTALALALLSSGPALAKNGPATSGECLRYIDLTERHWGIPRGMLRAIAYVEAGYQGTVWPWTLNIDGAPYYLPDRSAALRKMVKSNGRLHRDMAVGCMQIFVRYHEEKFRRPEDMIEPRNNVWYAGWYLRSLYDAHGTWTQAVAHYHSTKQKYQIEYLCRVVTKRIALGFQRPTPWYGSACR